MNFLSVENLTKSFADRLLFADLTFGIDQGQKVAIVAKNGSGKTTLLRCLMDLEQIDSGRVVYRNDIRVAFMEQTENMDESQTILESIFDHDLPELKALKKYNEALIDNDQDKLNECYEELTELNAWDYEVRVNQILSVLKLTDSRRLISSLSGGQKKRVALAKTLLSEADFMILDEPTNHLDLDMIEWLESYLSTSKSTLLMVTHDRYFLEVVCDTIFELSEETLYQYKGNFSYYLEKKAEREEQMQSTIDKARNTFRKELDWIRRQPKARSTKSKSRVDAFDDIKKTAHQRIDKDEIDIPIKMERLGTKILELHHMGKSFGETKILNDFSYHFKRKERVGIVGQNGAGKTTFLNLIQGKESLDKGKVVVGETIVFGYYSQELIQVDPNKRVIEVIKDIAEFIPLEKGKQLSAAQLLERFLFSRDAHYQYVHKLSGGEKRRLKLLTVLMSNPNFLILDEPTNDLDIFVMSVLEDYLQLFEGCLIVVSHDRYFMDKMVDHLFVFEGDGEIKDIIGNYTDYRKNQKLEARELKNNPPKEVVIKEQPAFVEKPVEKRKLSFKEKQEYENLPNEIEQLEAEKERLTIELSDGTRNNQQVMEIGTKLSKVVTELEQKSDRWLELAEFV